MASISTPIPTSPPLYSVLQKPMITTHGSPVLRMPLLRKMAKLRCSSEGKPAATSDEGGLAILEGKSSWPELVGEKGEVAAAIIEKENPRVFTIVSLIGSPGPANIVYNRVIVSVNSDGVVIITPKAG